MTEDTENRALRLKTLGNAVCPPQAYPIFKYISMIETGECVSICPYHRAHPDTQGQLLSLRHDKGADGGGRIRFSSRL